MPQSGWRTLIFCAYGFRERSAGKRPSGLGLPERRVSVQVAARAEGQGFWKAGWPRRVVWWDGNCAGVVVDDGDGASREYSEEAEDDIFFRRLDMMASTTS